MTHGTLTNKQTGQTLTGEEEEFTSTRFRFRIDGCMAFNVFQPAEWDFTPDPEPLPTKRGWYVSNREAVLGLLFELRPSGRWFTHNNHLRTEAEMRDRLPLVRLVREDGKPL